MRKFTSIVLIIGFLFVDFLFFHDIFKPGETTSVAQYLVGLLSLPVFAMSIATVLQPDTHHDKFK